MNPLVIIAPIFIVTVAIGYFFPSLSILNHLPSLSAKLGDIWNWLQSYGVTPIQLIGALGGVATVGGIIVAWLRAKLAATKQQADQQIYETEQYTSQQLKTQAEKAKALLTQKDQKITELTEQLATQDKDGLLSEAQKIITKKTEEMQKLQVQHQADLNALHTEIERLNKLLIGKAVIVERVK